MGLEAACWRYFGRDPQELSWGEAALLAVLPNAPSLIHPGKNRERLKTKRDNLLDRLQGIGAIDAFTCSLAKDESIPEAPQPLPRYARHLLARISNEGYAQMKVQSTIDAQLQIRIEQIIHDHHQRLKANQVFNGAAIVVEVSTGNVLAYVGNTEVKERGHYGDAVDVITSYLMSPEYQKISMDAIPKGMEVPNDPGYPASRPIDLLLEHPTHVQ